MSRKAKKARGRWRVGPRRRTQRGSLTGAGSPGRTTERAAGRSGGPGTARPGDPSLPAAPGGRECWSTPGPREARRRAGEGGREGGREGVLVDPGSPRGAAAGEPKSRRPTPGSPRGAAAGEPKSRRPPAALLVDPVHREGKRERKGVCPARAHAGRPPASRPPPGKGVRAAGPPGDTRARGGRAHRLPLLPRPSPGPRAPARQGRGRRAGRPDAQGRARRCAPPSRFRPPGSSHSKDGTGAFPPPAGPGEARETRQTAPRGGERPRGDPGTWARERKERATDGEGRLRAPTPPAPAAAGAAGRRDDKPLCRGLTFNRSQRGSCSATYETPTQKQVVYEWFSTRFPTNVRCVTGEGAAPFPAAPRFPGRGALRTGPRSRRAAGHATPRGTRAAARRRGRRGTGYPRPTEAPRRCRIVPPGRDSDLEAFSHNPTDGSFAPLAPQPSTYTKCLNLRFLSY